MKVILTLFLLSFLSYSAFASHSEDNDIISYEELVAETKKTTAPDAGELNVVTSSPQNIVSQMNNLRKNFRIRTAEELASRGDKNQVVDPQRVTRNAAEIVFNGRCKDEYCPIKYKMKPDAAWEEGFVHQNGFLDRGESANELADVPVPTKRPTRETEVPIKDDATGASESEKQRLAREAAERRKKEAQAAAKKEAEEKARRKNVKKDPCKEALKKNVCANSRSEIKRSKPLMCKLNKMGGNESSIFRSWVHRGLPVKVFGIPTKVDVLVRVSSDGRYVVTAGGQKQAQGNGQVCLTNGSLKLRAGSMNIGIYNLRTIRTTFRTDGGDVYRLNLSAQ